MRRLVATALLVAAITGFAGTAGASSHVSEGCEALNDPSLDGSESASVTLAGKQFVAGEVVSVSGENLGALWIQIRIDSVLHEQTTALPGPVTWTVPADGSYTVSYDSLGHVRWAVECAPATPAPMDCAPGSYSATETEPCDLAEPGHYVPTSGARAQLDCPAGTYQPDIGATQCLLAEVGYYVPATGAAAQSPCPSGTSTAGEGSASLSDCLPDFDGDGVPDSVDPDDDNDGIDDPDDSFPMSDLLPTVVIDGVDTGVANKTLQSGATFNDLIAQASAESLDPGDFVSAVAQLTNQWRDLDCISGREKSRIEVAAAQSARLLSI